MLLKLGMKGLAVEKLQVFLKIQTDGQFGPGTRKAVIDWQIKNKLNATGEIDENSWLTLKLDKVDTAFDIQKLKNLIPDSVLTQLPLVMSKFKINNVLRVCHFLSQCAHESDNFTLVRESLNYSEKRMLEIFKRDFDTNRDKVISVNESLKAKELVNNPEKIANFVYANQNGNGNEASGDGYRFSGRGFIQTTGRSNYVEFGKFIGIDLTVSPGLVATEYPLLSAAFFFEKNKLWSICDLGPDESTITKLTKRINGGTNGLKDRINKFNYFWSKLK